jgi:hypothetical protein
MDDDDAKGELFLQVYFRSGWTRSLPPSAVDLTSRLALEGPMSLHEIDESLRNRSTATWGLDSPAWEAAHVWTAEELAEPSDFDDDESDSTPQTPEEATAEEANELARRMAELDQFAASLHVPPVRTMRQLLDFTVACELVLVDSSGGYSLNPTAPLPEEVLPLSDEESKLQDKMRWQRLHEGTAQGIIQQFEPDANFPHNSLEFSLDSMGARLGAETEAVREGLTILLESGEFTTPTDLPRAGADHVMTVTVDWEQFARKRIGVQIAPLEE